MKNKKVFVNNDIIEQRVWENYLLELYVWCRNRIFSDCKPSSPLTFDEYILKEVEIGRLNSDYVIEVEPNE